MSRATFPALAIAALALAACGPDRVETDVVNVLVSDQQQRADLREAHAKGIITDAELARELARVGAP